ncbi:hypothetical protein GCM10017044_17840 [Kordiimonas sediminis]|uniref:Uncharacterized protein n=1 Tax=Kordiimonas sediminis TaxID=1735581 RepID=A0A919AU02_9PROT|nr:hypothetical protein [Kordiimonas sediminis]GHF23701.1 hypothetical protein GCM10017044_17840 [Kordiimonas sediminis]
MKFIKTLSMTTLAASLFLIAPHANAQMEAAKQENAIYMSVVLVDYKPGMREKAMMLVEEKFAPASKAADVPGPWVMHFDSGKWDAAYFWEHKGGYADLEYSTTPDDVKWWAALVKQEGSEEAAQKAWDTYMSYVATSTSVIGHHHRMEGENDE